MFDFAAYPLGSEMALLTILADIVDIYLNRDLSVRFTMVSNYDWKYAAVKLVAKAELDRYPFFLRFIPILHFAFEVVAFRLQIIDKVLQSAAMRIEKLKKLHLISKGYLIVFSPLFKRVKRNIDEALRLCRVDTGSAREAVLKTLLVDR